MSRVHDTWVRTGIVVLLTACADAPTAVPEGAGGGGDLDLLLPAIDRASLVSREIGTPVPDRAPPGPRAADVAPSELPGSPGGGAAPPEAAAIAEARTYADFQPGFGRATGQHSYKGNKSSVQTTVTVSFEGTALGNQSAYRESDAWYWFDLGAWKHIFASARFYTDRTCDLTAWGSSLHQAWSEMVVLPSLSVSRFGQVAQSSTSDVARQPACPDDEYAFPAGGSGSMLCYFWIEYDEYTGRVYSIDLMYCEGLGG